jgi:hypothetical protein
LSDARNRSTGSISASRLRTSGLLGDASVRVTEKHYKPWVKTLHAQLERNLARA